MLSEEQLEIIIAAIQPLFQYLENEVITDVAKRIQESLSYTRTAELQAISMRELGYSPARIRKEAMKLIKADEEYRKMVALNTLQHKRIVRKKLEEIRKEAYKANADIMKKAGKLSYANDLSIWKDAGKALTDDSYLSQLIEAFDKQTKNELKNLTQTTGFKTMSGFESIEDLYRREMDKALIKICSGTFSREKVIKDTVHELSQSGLRSIDFASGYSMQLDTAVRLAIRTGAHQLSGKIMDKNIEQTGENLVYVSKHWGARNTGDGIANHEQWQGKVYYIKDGTDYSEEAKRIGQDRIMNLWYTTGYSVDGSHENNPLGLYGYNCRHNHYVWFLGVSTFPKEQPQPGPVTIDGKTYDYYAISQKMRSMERAVRALKREKEALGKLGMDTKDIDIKIKRRVEEYKAFCENCNVREKTERMRYECGTSDLKKTKAWNSFEVSVAEPKKVVADSIVDDTIKVAKEEKSIEVHQVGKINRDIYKCITEDIVTDEVIITDNQIHHIKERHPNDYERFASYFEEIVRAPDFIIETMKPNTALILKEIQQEGEVFKTVLRLVTSNDSPEYKNSIITFMKIDEKEWNRLLRNKKILYRKE